MSAEAEDAPTVYRCAACKRELTPGAALARGMRVSVDTPGATCSACDYDVYLGQLGGL